MRRDTNKVPNGGGIHPSIKNLKFQKAGYGTLEKILFLLVAFTIILSAIEDSVKCSLVSFSSDQNSDGVFNYKDFGYAINQLFYSPLIALQSNTKFDAFFLFFEIQKKNCLSYASILLSGLIWFLSCVLVIRFILIARYIVNFVVHKLLFDLFKISPFTKVTKILFKFFYPLKKFNFNKVLIFILFAGLTASQLWIKNSERKEVITSKNEKSVVIKRNKQTDLVSSDRNYTNIYLNNSTELKKLDSRVANITSNDSQNIYTLSKALTEGLSTDLEKTYVIYKWVTTNIEYDTEAFFSNNLRGIGSASTVLQRRKAVCDGYAELIMRLGLQSNLLVEKVSGYAKGYGYTVGESIAKPNHAWNAVRIDGNWYLMDSTWDSGSVSRDEKRFKKNDGNYVYFLTNPQIFLYSHLPEIEKWQLIRNTWSKNQFFTKVNVNENAFKLGLNIDNHSDAVINADSLPYVLNFDSAAVLSGGLSSGGNRVTGDWVFVQYDNSGKSKVMISAPSNGTYTVNVFGDTTKRGTLFYGVLSYKFIVNNSLNNFSVFPKTFTPYDTSKTVLEYPLSGVLSSDQHTKFKLKVNGANKLVLYLNQKELEVMKEQDGYFVADLKLSKGDLVLYGNFNDSEPLKGIIRYQVK